VFAFSIISSMKHSLLFSIALSFLPQPIHL
jgi:hypothetical protein